MLSRARHSPPLPFRLQRNPSVERVVQKEFLFRYFSFNRHRHPSLRRQCKLAVRRLQCLQNSPDTTVAEPTSAQPARHSVHVPMELLSPAATAASTSASAMLPEGFGFRLSVTHSLPSAEPETPSSCMPNVSMVVGAVVLAALTAFAVLYRRAELLWRADMATLMAGSPLDDNYSSSQQRTVVRRGPQGGRRRVLASWVGDETGCDRVPDVRFPAKCISPASGTVYSFAFGSNLLEDKMTVRGVTPSSAINVILHGWSLKFNQLGFPPCEPTFANVVPAPGECVHGVLYELNLEAFEVLWLSEGAGKWCATQTRHAVVRGARSFRQGSGWRASGLWSLYLWWTAWGRLGHQCEAELGACGLLHGAPDVSWRSQESHLAHGERNFITQNFNIETI
ncbi:hypothetical protein CYMTET_24522 [Cymbomonas tetramitiformis]|uniref:gamma-glutamylcyclotransferase n=1 Tax=Cymbomonas tetramitiformis TaxID=36881 RepID=A0AAE0FX35_9CHLO|nr:hypothetical protein CYMTET_24522 [Cymbomonas tetramitiformis]